MFFFPKSHLSFQVVSEFLGWDLEGHFSICEFRHRETEAKTANVSNKPGLTLENAGFLFRLGGMKVLLLEEFRIFIFIYLFIYIYIESYPQRCMVKESEVSWVVTLGDIIYSTDILYETRVYPVYPSFMMPVK